MISACTLWLTLAQPMPTQWIRAAEYISCADAVLEANHRNMYGGDPYVLWVAQPSDWSPRSTGASP